MSRLALFRSAPARLDLTRLALAVAAPVGLAVALGATPAAAQEKMSWHAVDTDQGAALVFGVPETDQTMIFFLCSKGADDIVVQPMTGSKGLKKDDAARAILYAGSTKKIFDGKAIETEESKAINVEATGKMADLKALVKAGKLLTIETKGVKQSVTLTGAGEAFAKFEATCKAK